MPDCPIQANFNISYYVDVFEEEYINIAANKVKLAEIEEQEKAAIEKVNELLVELYVGVMGKLELRFAGLAE